jgi:hypothetical protein
MRHKCLRERDLGERIITALQVIDFIDLTGWLAALDDFRNWLIREAA